jgi:hypothetical protein
MSDITDFFNTLMFGQAAFLYLILFVGICFLITWKIRYFALVSITACIFQGIAYTQQGINQNYVPEIITLFVSACLFVYLFAGVLKK